jgi:hypothetical protein
MGPKAPSRVRIPPSPLPRRRSDRWLDSGIAAPVAQLDRASVYGTEGHRFESCRARYETRMDAGGFDILIFGLEGRRSSRPTCCFRRSSVPVARPVDFWRLSWRRRRWREVCGDLVRVVDDAHAGLGGESMSPALLEQRTGQVDGAAVLQGVAGGDQRAAVGSCIDEQNCEREPCGDGVADREVASGRPGVRRELADDGPVLGDAGLQAGCPPRTPATLSASFLARNLS